MKAKRKNNTGVAMTGGNGQRVDDDFYATPPLSTEALIPVLRQARFPKKLWECACGEGHMSITLARHGFDVESTDLIDRGYGMTQDFLETTKPLGDGIVTNVPFDLAEAFIEHALGFLEIEYVAYILNNNFWNASGRLRLFDRYPPAIVLPMTWRLDSKGLGRPTMNALITVWSPHTSDEWPKTRYMPLRAEKGAGKPVPIWQIDDEV